MEPNTYFAGPKPALKTVVIKIIGEPSVRRLQLSGVTWTSSKTCPKTSSAFLPASPAWW